MDPRGELLRKVSNYYDEQGLLIRYPSKKPLRQPILSKMAESFLFGRDYTEKEVNAVIQAHIAFSDIELIRRELIEGQYLARLRDGSKYWRMETK